MKVCVCVCVCLCAWCLSFSRSVNKLWNDSQMLQLCPLYIVMWIVLPFSGIGNINQHLLSVTRASCLLCSRISVPWNFRMFVQKSCPSSLHSLNSLFHYSLSVWMVLQFFIVNVSVLKTSSSVIWTQACLLLLLEWQSLETINCFRLSYSLTSGAEHDGTF